MKMKRYHLALALSLHVFYSYVVATTDPIAPVFASFESGSSKVVILTSDFTEQQVRTAIGEAKVNGTNPSKWVETIFFIEPGAQWTLTETLHIPDRVTLIGSNVDGEDYTFLRGFDGDDGSGNLTAMVELGRFCTIYGVVFDGNKHFFSGNGVHYSENTRENLLTRVVIRNNSGNGMHWVNKSAYYSNYVNCSFINNDGYGIFYDQIGSHYTDNVFTLCEFSKNGLGGIGFQEKEESSVWESCLFSENKGPAFHQLEVLDDPTGASYCLNIRNCEFITNDGPAWLNSHGFARGIAFEDCAFQGNIASNSSYDGYGLFHVENEVSSEDNPESGLNAEVRGGVIFADNSDYLMKVETIPDPDTGRTSDKLVVSGGGVIGMIDEGNVAAPGMTMIVLDSTLLSSSLVEGPDLDVKSLLSLDPATGLSVAPDP
ncbi:MAG: right-handed parallel beta-helix repeat-containing protein [Verrucomicrobiota bacterium]